jgi:two-component system, OmpR family, heavy metal sensor histidine kinase CusS
MKLNIASSTGSLTGRLTVLFTVITIVLLAGANTFLYHYVEREWWTFERQDLELGSETLRVLVAAVHSPQELASRVPELSYRLGDNRRLSFAVQDGSSRVVMSTLPAPWSDEIGKQSGDIESPIRWQPLNNQRYLVVTNSSWFGSGAPARLVVALDVTNHVRIRNIYRQILIVVTIMGGLLAAVLGFIVARKAVGPLQHMAAAARDITASRLGERLRPGDAPTELRELVFSFNDMLERLQDSFRRLADFSSDIAHELRTPINNLLGQTQVALSRTRSADEYRAVLESNEEEYERMSRMIEDMLFLAEADDTQTAVKLEAVDLVAEVDKLIEYFELLFEEKGLRVALDGQGVVQADPHLVQRVIGNLLSNAIRHTPAGGAIAIAIRPESSDKVAVSVSNPGAGIPAQDLPRVFDRFYRVDKSREKRSEGAGLGLAIVKTIMHLLGGSVTVQSEPGKETCFTLVFKRALRTALRRAA